eukprot:GHVU01201522.1.p1 GENE.GHVU01201522.1~~GHVU01201522.1.p1  ORF type:complete len:235 (-),score=22.55 GHVU01201522.1:1234-1938(-)
MQLELLAAIMCTMLTPIICTWDMNIHEIQMVADHLTLRECRRLSEALRETTYRLSHRVTGEKEAHVPCLGLLLQWDQHRGRNMTFHEMFLRLREIGRPDLAQKLSRTVNHELSENAKRNFLGKDMLDEEDKLEEEKEEDTTASSEDEDFPHVRKHSSKETKSEEKPSTEWTWKHTLAVTLTSAGLTGICLVTILCYLPGRCRCDTPFYTDLRERFYMRMVGIRPPQGEKMFIFI